MRIAKNGKPWSRGRQPPKLRRKKRPVQRLLLRRLRDLTDVSPRFLFDAAVMTGWPGVRLGADSHVDIFVRTETSKSLEQGSVDDTLLV